MSIIDELNDLDKMTREGISEQRRREEEEREIARREAEEQEKMQKEEELKQAKIARRMEIDTIINSNEADYDNPVIYDIEEERDDRWFQMDAGEGVKGRIRRCEGSYIGTERRIELSKYFENRKVSRQIKKGKMIKKIEEPKRMGGYRPTLIEVKYRNPEDEEEKKYLDNENEKIRMIKESEDPRLEEKGVLYFTQVDGTTDEIETTLRKALLAVGNVNIREHFKTYREIEEERKEQQRQEEQQKQEEQAENNSTESNEKDTSQETGLQVKRASGITLNSIRNAIHRFFGTKER